MRVLTRLDPQIFVISSQNNIQDDMNKFQVKSEYKFALILECILYVNTGWQQVSKGISIRQGTQDFYFFFPFRVPDSYPLLKITNVIYLVLLLELWEFGDVGPFCGPTQG